jgi:hypothetical protein
MPAESPSELLTPRARQSDLRALLLAILIFSALSLTASITSRGFLEADGCTHYLYARFAFAEPHYLVNVWGRPLCTGIYAIPAIAAGRFGVRTMSLMLAIGCALVARAIAGALGDRRPTLSTIFTLAQPLLFLHSFSELTELPFALLLAAAFLAYARRNLLLMTLLISLSPLSRPEGFGFLVLAALALAAHRRLRWLPLLPIPLIIWDIEGWRIFGQPIYAGFSEHLPHILQWIDWLPQNWPYAEKSAYLPGSAFHFIMLMPAIASPLIFPAMCVGIWRTFVPVRFGNHQQRCRVFSAAIPILILVVHSFLYFTGRMASSGELRYMLVVGPFWGILSARGWMWIFDRYRWNWVMPIAALVSLAPIVLNHFYQVIPLTYSDDWIEASNVATWLNQTPLRHDYPRVLAAHPGIFYFLGVSQTNHSVAREWTKTVVDAAPPGTILVWDGVYGVYNADTLRSVKLDEILAAGWIAVPTSLARDKLDPKTKKQVPDWRFFISPLPVAKTN